MKLRIENENFGSLTLFYGEEEYKTIIVPINTLIDWYPLSNAYEYKLSKNRKKLELKRMRSNLPTSYGISTNTQKNIKEDRYVCNTETWLNESVQRENYYILEKAKKYNLPIITEPFNKDIVEKGFNDLGIIFNNLKDIIVDKYLETKDNNYIKNFNLKKEETQLSEALKNCDESIDFTYGELGQIYNMLLLMKKICRVQKE